MAAVAAGWATVPVAAAAGADAPAKAAFSWQDPHAKVLPNGALEWAPRPFVFEKGDRTRYIDFEAGDDAKDGKTPQTAWKHHPWDANATGRGQGVQGHPDLYFQGRGRLSRRVEGGRIGRARESHPPDPRSGLGHGRGRSSMAPRRSKAAGKRRTPRKRRECRSPRAVWYIDIGKNYDPDPDGYKFSAMWQVDGDKVERLHIAREPNYDLSDPDNPVKNWPVWTGYDNKTSTFTSPALKDLGDKDSAGRRPYSGPRADFLMGAATITSMRSAPTTRMPVRLMSDGPFDSSKISRMPRAPVHFMIENVARFLDAPGEYFYPGARAQRRGGFTVWPAGGVDPNSVAYEVAQTRLLDPHRRSARHRHQWAGIPLQ